MGTTTFSGPVVSLNGFVGEFTGTIPDNVIVAGTLEVTSTSEFNDDVLVNGNVTATEFIGDVTGDLTGDVTGDLTGDVTGDLTGDVTGNVTGDVDAESVSASVMLLAPSYAFANLPDEAANEGGIIYVTDADPAAALCFSNGTNWIDLLTGTTVTDGE
jgi:hypothetical protein